jgi:hypothetical protein
VILTTGDFDRDGDIDFIASNTKDLGIYILKNNGRAQSDFDGRIANWTAIIFEGYVTLASADLDRIFLYANNGRGGFHNRDRIENLRGTIHKGGVNLSYGDFDGDGDMDFIAIHGALSSAKETNRIPGGRLNVHRTGPLFGY